MKNIQNILTLVNKAMVEIETNVITNFNPYLDSCIKESIYDRAKQQISCLLKYVNKQKIFVKMFGN